MAMLKRIRLCLLPFTNATHMSTLEDYVQSFILHTLRPFSSHMRVCPKSAQHPRLYQKNIYFDDIHTKLPHLLHVRVCAVRTVFCLFSPHLLRAYRKMF